MIQITYHITDQANTFTKKIELSNRLENNLDMMYENTSDTISQNKEITLYQLLIVCTHCIVEKTRENPVQEIIEYHLLEKLENPMLASMFCSVKKITAHIIVDAIPKKIISIQLTKKISLVAQQVLR